ncbi:MAG: GAF domain-containing protein [Chloroflexi bacterium]|nr:GAF domain-containing protein [Chloroflexota bacterium]
MKPVPAARDAWGLSDSRRDAERYYRLLLALERATEAVKQIEDQGRPDIDEVLGRLLPDVAYALNAQQAFVARLQNGSEPGQRSLEITVAYPSPYLRGQCLPCLHLFDRLIAEGRPRVIDPLGEESPRVITGLEAFGATSAILVRAQSLLGLRIVGVCNKRDAKAGPYLAADGRALDNIVELVAIGARVGERRRQELESVHQTSTAVSAEYELDKLLPMVSNQAAEVFRAHAASVMLWDEEEQNLVVKAGCGLSETFRCGQRIAKDLVYREIHWPEERRPVLLRDLRSQPFGEPRLIEQERLCTALSAPLITANRLLGLLNIYSREQPRDFTSDETELTMIYANQVAIAVRNARLIEELREKITQLEAAQAELLVKERMEQELALARQVQQSVLPRTFPHVSGYAFAARNAPARQVGGDFYDVIPLDADRFGLVIADVADKGMPAALYMALTRSLILAEARRERSPAAVLSNVNRILLEMGGPGMSELGEPSMFVTAFYGVVDRTTRRLTYARGGHDRPLLARGPNVHELAGRGIVLGLFEAEGFHVSEESSYLTVGDRLVLYTDGLTDSLSADGDAFGIERLRDFLSLHSDLSPAELCDAAFAELAAYRGGAEQEDDMALLVMGVG